MPDYTTHIYFAEVVKGIFDIKLEHELYLLGALYPDASRENDDFNSRHKLDEYGNVSLEALNRYKQLVKESIEKSYLYGYMTHLYLDYYFDINKDRIYLSEIEGMDNKKVEMAKIKKYNLSQDLHITRCNTDKLESLCLESIQVARNQLSNFTNKDARLESDNPINYIKMIESIKKSFNYWLLTDDRNNSN